MSDVAKSELSERDICTKFITPAIEQAGWLQSQFREEVKLTAGRVMVRGNTAARIRNPEAKGGPKRADYVLYGQPNLALAVLEAKQNRFSIGHGMPQALEYAEMLDAPFAISSNGDGFLIHDRTGLTQPVEREMPLQRFPTYDELWALYQKWRGLTKPDEIQLLAQPHFADGSGREPHYYQRVATNRAIEAIAKGQDRLLLVMATGTGKTYTAFQIIWRLWKAKRFGGSTRWHHSRAAASMRQTFVYKREFQGLAVATRLLCMKRPDYFVCIDGKNQSGLAKALGIKPTKIQINTYWDTVIEPILESPWYQSEQPVDPTEESAWNARVAMIDALFYQPSQQANAVHEHKGKPES